MRWNVNNEIDNETYRASKVAITPADIKANKYLFIYRLLLIALLIKRK